MSQATLKADTIKTGNSSTNTAKGWRAIDTEWMLALFGTAIGAGVLFLPINAGLGGIWPLIMMTIIIGPMTYLSHRGLTRLCLSSSNPNTDLSETVTEHFGTKAGNLITFAYFAAIYPFLLVYAIGLTNTVTSLMTSQLGMDEPNRAILSFILVAMLVGVMVTGQKTVLKITNALVYPLIFILLGTSLYLVPDWNTAQFDTPFELTQFVKTMFLAIPVLVFAFSHAPAISSFATSYRKELGDDAEPQASKVLNRTTIMLVGFTMFFVYSCVFTLSPEQLVEAKAANISILSYFAENTANPIFGWLAQFVAIIAITSSFFGHYMGTKEGLHGMLTAKAREQGKPVNEKKVNSIIVAFLTFSLWFVAYVNPSVMSIIEAMIAPVLALILFILPVVAVNRVPSMQKYRSKVNIFTFTMGVITIVGFVASQLL